MDGKPYYLSGPCPNCGEEDAPGTWKGARHGSSDWGHKFMCCSEECGKALREKLDNSQKWIIIQRLRQMADHLEFQIARGDFSTEPSLFLLDGALTDNLP